MPCEGQEGREFGLRMGIGGGRLDGPQANGDGLYGFRGYVGWISGRCVCRDMTPLASCRTGESGGAYGALYEEAFGSDSALSLSSVLQFT